jgi:hypothetical protein
MEQLEIENKLKTLLTGVVDINLVGCKSTSIPNEKDVLEELLEAIEAPIVEDNDLI